MSNASFLATNWGEWTAIGTLSAAVATLLLAGVTAWLVSTTTRQIAIGRRRLDAAQRPHVFPSFPKGHQDPSLLPVTNAGAGPALNLQCQLTWRSEGGQIVSVIPTSLGPGESRELVVDWRGASPIRFENVSGVLDYEDIAEGRWRTEFVVDEFEHVRVQGTQLLLSPDGTVPTGDEAQPWRLPSGS